MSEETQVFRGDHAPELSQVEPGAARSKAAPVQPASTTPATKPADTPTATAAPAVDKAVTAPAAVPSTEADAQIAGVCMAAPSKAAPEPALNLAVDESQLWHVPEALRQRIAQLHSTSVATAHLLDEQEQESRRIEEHLKQLKSR